MKTLKVVSDMAEIVSVRDFLRESLEGLELSERVYYIIELSLLEICTNIILYAYPTSKGDIFLKIWEQDGKVYIEIRDTGVPFNPRKTKTPDINRSIKKKRTGGMGIFLARQLMDGFDYKRESKQNVLTMFKTIKEIDSRKSI